ncbi:hypothetical protein OESDEN_23905 [Oesophagostomum dentatum]|uniref:Uncharacterized protein n=1 Tax=Oesophagostomum dentatum TaxID=61180 RepID=A0A0B1RZR2_OESDE|nr:hypothetical protein OESDEN_23905 [Oesophagostomum dentatum]
MSAVFDNLRKSIQLRIFKNKDAAYHPRDEEDLDARKRAQKIRDKERSRSEAAKIRAAIARDAHDHKNKHPKKHGTHEHGLYVSFHCSFRI